jgi:hypothetical protein
MEKKRRWADRRQIAALDPKEVHYWSKFLGVEENDILVAVDKVGTSVERVRQYLYTRGPVRWKVSRGRDERRRVAGRM